MRLNNDAVRAVLLHIEETLNGNFDSNFITNWEILSGIEECKLYEKDDISYAIEVLLTTDFLNLVRKPIYDPDGYLLKVEIKGLTFNGCNFLDNIRKPEIWDTVKKKAKSFGGSSIIALSTAGSELAKSLLTDPNALQNFLSGIDNIKNLLP